jgi:MFS family permease
MTRADLTLPEPDLATPASAGTLVIGRWAVLAAVIANALEWYDFAVYGFFAITIAKLFFPAGDATVSLLLTVATFGVGFVMHPVGALVLGAMADVPTALSGPFRLDAEILKGSGHVTSTVVSTCRISPEGLSRLRMFCPGSIARNRQRRDLFREGCPPG